MTKVVSRPQIPLGTFEIVLNVTWPSQQWRNELPVNGHVRNSFPLWQVLSNVCPCVMTISVRGADFGGVILFIAG